MSDEERDAAGELEISGDDPSDASDLTMGGRLETIHRSMSTLGMRIDALVTSTTSYRSALTDRLNEYADLVTKLTRAQATDLEEYRRANERTLADLRRGLATSEETLERVGARIDSMLTDSESTDDSSRRVLAEVRSILEAQENLGRFLTESLDEFGDQVIGRLTASEEAAAEQLEALKAAVSDVDRTPDPTLGLLDGRLAGIEDRLAVVASNDSAAALGSRFDTLHAAIDGLASSLESQTDDAVVAQITKLEGELASTGKVATESYGELAGLRAKVDAVLETTANESGAVTGALEQLKETLLDVASGEVVGALWDEVRQVRATVEALVDRDETTADPAAVEALRSDVSGLTASVRDLLEQAEVVDEDGIAESDGGYLSALAADVAALREELSRGLVVDPSDDFGESVENLRTDFAALGERLSVVAELRDSVAALRDVTESSSTAETVVSAELPAELEVELRAVRSGVEDIIGRLDEGLVIADDAADSVTPPSAELTDQIATLRDQVAAEFERIGHLVEDRGGESVDLTPLTARLDRLHDELGELPSDVAAPDLGPVLGSLEEIQNGIASLLDRPEASAPPAAPAPAASGDGYAQVDPDVIDLLREEIRSAGAAGDELIETLAGELKALRRRIRLRAEGEIFSDEQLEVIAEAVARRLGE